MNNNCKTIEVLLENDGVIQIEDSSSEEEDFQIIQPQNLILNTPSIQSQKINVITQEEIDQRFNVLERRPTLDFPSSNQDSTKNNQSEKKSSSWCTQTYISPNIKQEEEEIQITKSQEDEQQTHSKKSVLKYQKYSQKKYLIRIVHYIIKFKEQKKQYFTNVSFYDSFNQQNYSGQLNQSAKVKISSTNIIKQYLSQRKSKQIQQNQTWKDHAKDNLVLFLHYQELQKGVIQIDQQTQQKRYISFHIDVKERSIILDGTSQQTNLELNQAKISQKDLITIVYGMKMLQRISLQKCSQFKSLTFPNFHKLKQLNLSSSSINKLQISKLSKLKTLDLSFCQQLDELTFFKLEQLQNINFNGSSIKKLTIIQLPKLQKLLLENCKNLVELCIQSCQKLTYLKIHKSPFRVLKTKQVPSLLQIDICQCNLSYEDSKYQKIDCQNSCNCANPKTKFIKCQVQSQNFKLQKSIWTCQSRNSIQKNNKYQKVAK